MKKRGYAAAVIFVILVLPVLVMLCIKQGKNRYKELPYYGNPKGVTPAGDTIRHTVKNFVFTDENGNSFSSASLKGNVSVVDFFFTRCGSICPVLTKNLMKVQEACSKRKDFRLLSFTIDPEFDTSSVLLNYKKKYKINAANWHFLTGVKDSIYDVMNMKGFLLLKPEPDNLTKELEHTEMICLVDKEGHVRGQYKGTQDDEIDRLIDEIRLLYINYKQEEK